MHWPLRTTRSMVWPRRSGSTWAEMQGRGRESKFRYPRPQQVVEFEHATLEPGQGAGLVAARCQSSLHALAQPPVFVVDGGVDAVAQVSCGAQFARRSRQAEYRAANDAFPRAGRQHLEKVH